MASSRDEVQKTSRTNDDDTVVEQQHKPKSGMDRDGGARQLQEIDLYITLTLVDIGEGVV